jgi:hypothetical protein
VGLQPGVLADLVEPVDLHAGRADHQEAALVPGGEVRERGQGLHRLARPISSPRIARCWWMAYWAPKTW